jgi:hypothetical protein
MHRFRFSAGTQRFNLLGIWASTNQEGAVGRRGSRLKAAVGHLGRVTNSVGIGVYQQCS